MHMMIIDYCLFLYSYFKTELTGDQNFFNLTAYNFLLD